MTNLFSTFDPSTSVMSLSWLIIISSITVITTNIWKISSTSGTLQNSIISNFINEVNYTLSNSENGTEMIMILMFVTILLLNFLAIYPQIFSPTAHLTVTLPLSLMSWMTIIIFGWINNTSHILSHLLPQGTPVPLINFIVLIELVSNLIRPVTLCVRLTANIIAGHLLISLLGNAIISLSLAYSTLSLVTPIVLTVLESAVAFIQAYVFITLITLYTAEIN